MALLERVATLIRANLNDLIDKAEDPERMIKQLILDMENQLLQVKTQVAISIADQHVLEGKLKENAEAEKHGCAAPRWPSTKRTTRSPARPWSARSATRAWPRASSNRSKTRRHKSRT